ncbi:D-alanyl-D-alanine carboxypeptidase family protein [Bacillus sp. FJAT-44742]|uniref:D-alanyl-D-alanine carboxypeptidase family protein n=1 Tax=Bacillus sp. FJAT-44742 TaxID=2014005 RepID=UPI001E2B3DA4|nr:D-alanyl-D-alanine carboxypeptidase family protein [Bacillus sp. FJAT-44742]
MGKNFLGTGAVAVLSSLAVFGFAGSAEASGPDLEAEAAILVDAETGKIIYQDNIDVILPPASMTKIMTEYLVHEAIEEGEISWDQTVPISDKVRELSHVRALSNVPLRPDEEYTVRELYESMAIYSANAATIALAELISGSETEFVDKMNEKAAELGLDEYEFVNSSGLNNNSMGGLHPEGTGADAENMMSARATAKLAYNLLDEYPEVLETASIGRKSFKEGTDDEIDMVNWNWMLPELDLPFAYEGLDGLKTGYTDLAGNAFTATAEREDLRLISVVMRTDSREARFEETAKLLDYGFDNYEHEEVAEEGYQIEGHETLPVSRGTESEVSISTAEPLTLLLHRNEEADAYTPNLTINGEFLDEENQLTAPIEQGEVIGYIDFEYTGENSEEYLSEQLEEAKRVPVIVNEEVEKAGWFSLGMRSIGGFFSGMWNNVADTVKGWF